MIIKKKIQIYEDNYLAIDLTEPLNIKKIKVFPKDPIPKLWKVFSKIKNGWEHYIWLLSDHLFHAHFDTPKHQNPDRQDQGAEIYNISWWFKTAFMIDLSTEPEALEKKGIKYLSTVRKKHLKPFASLFKKRQAVVIRTGYDKWLKANRNHKNLPYFDKEAVKFIESFKNIKTIAIDSLTVDPDGEHIAHKAFKDRFILESLVNLDKIPPEAKENFTLISIPIRIVGATGGPIGICALVKS